MRTQNWVVTLAVFVLLLLVSVACQPQVVEVERVVEVPVEKQVVVTVEVERPAAKETTFERAKREGIVRVAFANEKPFAYANPDGTLTGQSVEISRVVFERLGIGTLEGLLVDWGSLIPGLLAGRFDAITAGMWITPARCEVVIFTEPDYCIGEAFIVKAGNPLNLNSYEDCIENPECIWSSVPAGAHWGYMEKLGMDSARMVAVPDGAAGIAALQADRVHAFGISDMAAMALIETANDPNLEIATPFTDPIIDGASVKGCGGVVFRPEDVDLRDAFSAELAKMMASGEVLEILEEFGFGELNLPGDLTMEQLCGWK